MKLGATGPSGGGFVPSVGVVDPAPVSVGVVAGVVVEEAVEEGCVPASDEADEQAAAKRARATISSERRFMGFKVPGEPD